jgi:hypothetical protein
MTSAPAAIALDRRSPPHDAAPRPESVSYPSVLIVTTVRPVGLEVGHVARLVLEAAPRMTSSSGSSAIGRSHQSGERGPLELVRCSQAR